MEAELKAKRENLTNIDEIANFKKMFKGNKGRAPKILKKNQQPSED